MKNRQMLRRVPLPVSSMPTSRVQLDRVPELPAAFRGYGRVGDGPSGLAFLGPLAGSLCCLTLGRPADAPGSEAHPAHRRPFAGSEPATL